MPGPMTVIETQMARVGLDISRQLNMGNAVILRLLKAQEDGTGGTVTVREYTWGFDRVPEVERQRGDGSQVVVDIADYGHSAGQLADDLIDAEFLQFVIDGVETPMISMNRIPDPAYNEGQVYRITCEVPLHTRKYFRTGRS